MIRNLYFIFYILFLTACAASDVSGLPVASGIIVVKSQRQMHLLGQDGKSYKTYKISLGGNPIGPKECEGDLKTPEGIYTIEAHNPESKYHLSLKISYPNEEDVKRAKIMGTSPGSDIFIHGAPDSKWFLEAYTYQFNPAWTDGCIALSNQDMDEIWALVADGTPIQIFP